MSTKRNKSPYNFTWFIGVVLVALIGAGYFGMDGCNTEDTTNDRMRSAAEAQKRRN